MIHLVNIKEEKFGNLINLCIHSLKSEFENINVAFSRMLNSKEKAVVISYHGNEFYLTYINHQAPQYNFVKSFYKCVDLFTEFFSFLLSDTDITKRIKSFISYEFIKQNIQDIFKCYLKEMYMTTRHYDALNNPAKTEIKSVLELDTSAFTPYIKGYSLIIKNEEESQKINIIMFTILENSKLNEDINTILRMNKETPKINSQNTFKEQYMRIIEKLISEFQERLNTSLFNAYEFFKDTDYSFIVPDFGNRCDRLIFEGIGNSIDKVWKEYLL